MKNFAKTAEKIGDFILHSIFFFVLFVIILGFLVFYGYPISPVTAIVLFSLLTVPAFFKWDTALLSIIGAIVFLLSYRIGNGGEVPSFVLWLLGIIIWEFSVYISLASPKRWRRIKTLSRFLFLKMKRT